MGSYSILKIIFAHVSSYIKDRMIVYHHKKCVGSWRTPTLLERLKCESKSGNDERRSWVHFPNHSTLGVEGRAGPLGWGLGWVTSRSIIQTNMRKPNNKLVSAWLEPTWECVGSFPHTLLHSREHEMWLLSFSLGPHLCDPFALVANPKLVRDNSKKW
jgi:hypothetical protein